MHINEFVFANTRKQNAQTTVDLSHAFQVFMAKQSLCTIFCSSLPLSPFRMEALTTVAVNTIGPVVDVLESLSFIGVNTYVVKNAVLVSIENCILLHYKAVLMPVNCWISFSELLIFILNICGI